MATAPNPAPVVPAAARPLELADIFRRHGPQYRLAHALSREQRAVMTAVQSCRTPALGGHLERCERCGATRAVYHSCRNRHCPKCQALAQERWLQARRQHLLPVDYFHVVFTLPHELNPVSTHRPRLLHDLLFRCAADTLQQFSADPSHLGGELGITCVLHTWSQELRRHVHVHCLVTGGALARDGSRWIPARRGFLFPVRALSLVFRGKFLDGLRGLVQQSKLPAELVPPRLMRRLRRHRWVVYCKPPFAGPEQVLAYLGRYTHRIGLSNKRLVDDRDGRITFRCRARKGENRPRLVELAADEFIRRFLHHVLPKGYVRIRHFGLHANRSARQKLERCRHLLNAPAPAPPPTEEPAETVLRLTGHDPRRCPICRQGQMIPLATLPSGQLPPAAPHWLDTS